MPATSRGKIYNSLQLGNFFHLFSHKGLWSGSETTVLQKRADWPLISQFLRRKTRAPSFCSLNNASKLTGRFCILRKLCVSVSSHAHTHSKNSPSQWPFLTLGSFFHNADHKKHNAQQKRVKWKVFFFFFSFHFAGNWPSALNASQSLKVQESWSENRELMKGRNGHY